jgi:hypothetical protein
VRDALWYFNWDDDDITELFEADLLGSLVFQLAHLERRVFNENALPTELQFKSILPSDWKSYLKTWGSWSPDKKISRSVTDFHADHQKLPVVVDVMHNSAYTAIQIACTGRELLKT